jgi:hypothetical protein
MMHFAIVSGLGGKARSASQGTTVAIQQTPRMLRRPANMNQ